MLCRHLPCKPDSVTSFSPDAALMVQVVGSKRLVGTSTQSASLLRVATGSAIHAQELGKLRPATKGCCTPATDCTWSPDSQQVLVTAMGERLGGMLACLGLSGSFTHKACTLLPEWCLHSGQDQVWLLPPWPHFLGLIDVPDCLRAHT